MIILIIGPPGAGKTRKLAMLVKERYDGGQTVVSNIKFTFPFTPLASIDLSKEPELENCVMVLDEVHTIVDSRRSMRGATLDWSYLFLQTRKMRVDIVATSQFIGQPDLRFRDVVDLVITARATAWETVDGHKQATDFEYTAIRADGMNFTWPEQRGPEVGLYDTREVVKKGVDSFSLADLAPKAKPGRPRKVDRRADVDDVF